MRGVTQERYNPCCNSNISTHTPHARRDVAVAAGTNVVDISTHTPHARRDNRRESPASVRIHFYSHASCEA